MHWVAIGSEIARLAAQITSLWTLSQKADDLQMTNEEIDEEIQRIREEALSDERVEWDIVKRGPDALG